MDLTTAQLYDLLVEKGFDKAQVRDALAEVASTKEVNARVESLEERIDRRFAESRAELYRALLLHGFIVVGAILGAVSVLASYLG